MKLHTEKREEAHVALTGLSRKPRLYNMITTRHFSDSEMAQRRPSQLNNVMIRNVLAIVRASRKKQSNTRIDLLC